MFAPSLTKRLPYETGELPLPNAPPNVSFETKAPGKSLL